MSGDSYLSKLANEVLEATERVATRLEEGWSVLVDGKLPEQAPHDDSAAPVDHEELKIEEDEYESPLPGMAESVLGDIMSSQVGPQTPMEHFHAFRSAITWREPFILSILVFHLVAFLLVIYVTRRNRGLAPRIGLMAIIGALVRSAEYLNKIGHENWERFSTQDYFDRKGIFVGVMFCGPLLLDCFIMLLFYLREASQLLVQVKKEEIRRKKLKQQQDKKEGGGNRKKKPSKKQD